MSVKNNTHLIVIAAPSGAGKSTLCKKLLEDFSSLTLSISSTTRLPRGSETPGIEYHFMNREDFEKKIREKRFAEWALVHGNYYGTTKASIDQAFEKGQSVLLDIDVQGAEQLAAVYPEQCHRFFIAPPSLEILESRLRARGTDSEASIQERLKNAQKEMIAGKTFDHWIVNNSLEEAYEELRSILETKYHFECVRFPATKKKGAKV